MPKTFVPFRFRGRFILTASLALAAGPCAAIDQDTRLDALEARLEALTRRVQAMESVLKETGQSAAAPAIPKGQPLWESDDYSDGEPLRVLKSSLDRASGRLDVLLDVVTEIPDPEHWTNLNRGASVPLTVSLTPAPGDAQSPLRLRVERAGSIVPGSRIHVTGQIPPDLARQVRKILLLHAPTTETLPEH